MIVQLNHQHTCQTRNKKRRYWHRWKIIY